MLLSGKYFIFAFFVFLLNISSLRSEEAPQPVARVGDIKIYQHHFDSFRHLFASELSSIDADKRDMFVYNFITIQALLANASKSLSLEKSPEFASISSLYNLRALHDIYYKNNIYDVISDVEISDYYSANILLSPRREQVKARHILVSSKEEAEDLLKQLSSGADFAALAKKHSKGPSASNGGELGFITRGQTVPEFENSLFELKKDEVSKPVKTKFGWHIIKADDKKQQDVPPLEELKSAIKDTIAQTNLQKKVEELKKTYIIQDLR